MGPLLKDKNNPAFKSKYATLASTYDTIDDALSNNNIVTLQMFRVGNEGQRFLITRFLHESGEYIDSEIEVVAVSSNDPQKVGSAITYYRRYALQALAGIAPEDDDGNAAAGRVVIPTAAPAPPPVGPEVTALRAKLKARGASKGSDALAILAKFGYAGTFAGVTEAQAAEFNAKLDANPAF